MVAGVLDRVKMSTATTGQGTITLGSAASGHFSMSEAGAVDGATYAYLIEEGSDFEIGEGVYTASGTTLTRTNVKSKISGSAGTTKMTLAGAATVAIVARVSEVLGLQQQVFDSSGTWTKPSFGTWALIECWGAGGGGSKATGTDAGGGGGAYKAVWKLLSDLGSTETVTIGAGGSGTSTTNTAGGNGGNTSFGSHCTAYGGGGGKNGGPGGYGGGPFANGSAANATTWGINDTKNMFGFGGLYDPCAGLLTKSASGGDRGGGGGGIAANGQYVCDAGNAIWGGAGGGAISGDKTSAPGTSQFGGNGGAGSDAGTAGNGVQPGGGGGGTRTGTSGAGAAGRVRVTVF